MSQQFERGTESTGSNSEETVVSDIDPEAKAFLDGKLREGTDDDGFESVDDLASRLKAITGEKGEKIVLSKPDYPEGIKEDKQEGPENTVKSLEDLGELFHGQKNSGPKETVEDRTQKIADVEAQIAKLKRKARVPTPILKRKKQYKPTIVIEEKKEKGILWKKFRGFFSKRNGEKNNKERREDFES